MNKKQRDEAVKTLRAAKSLLVDVGWTKGVQYRETISPTGKTLFAGYCAWGAINKADGPGEEAAKRFLLKAIKPKIKSKSEETLKYYDDSAIENAGVEGIWLYNDRSRTKKEDILTVFDDAIALASEG